MALIKTVLIGVLIGFLFGLMTCKSCTKPCKPAIIDSVRIKTDTVRIIIPAERSEIPQPTLAKETPPRIDSFIQFLDLEADTNAILKPLTEKFNSLAARYNKLLLEHNTARSYIDTSKFSNATAIVESDVSGNKLQRSRVTLRDMVKETVTNTNTVYVADKRVVGYWGLSGGYQFNDSSLYVGSSFRLKFKNDMLIGIAAKYSSRSNLLVEGEYAVPIRLRKRK
jgi:hypothetical protein